MEIEGKACLPWSMWMNDGEAGVHAVRYYYDVIAEGYRQPAWTSMCWNRPWRGRKRVMEQEQGPGWRNRSGSITCLTACSCRQRKDQNREGIRQKRSRGVYCGEFKMIKQGRRWPHPQPLHSGSEGSRSSKLTDKRASDSDRLCGHCHVPAIHLDDLYDPCAHWTVPVRTISPQWICLFHGGALPAKVPEEYWEYIEDIRKASRTWTV